MRCDSTQHPLSKQRPEPFANALFELASTFNTNGYLQGFFTMIQFFVYSMLYLDADCRMCGHKGANRKSVAAFQYLRSNVTLNVIV